MALFTEHIVETYRAALELKVCSVHSPFGAALFDEFAETSRLRDTREVALHVRHETGNTGLRESLGQYLESYSLAGTCGAGYQTVAVGHLTDYVDRPLSRVCYI